MIPRAIRDLSARFEASRLSTKILILSVMTTMVPLIFLTALFDHANTENGRQLLRTTLSQQSAEQAAEIEDRLQAWQRTGVQLSHDPSLAAFLATGQGDGPTLATLNRGLQLDPDFRAIMVVDNAGQILLSTDPAAGSNPILAPAQLRRLAPPGATGVSDPLAGQGLQRPAWSTPPSATPPARWGGW